MFKRILIILLIAFLVPFQMYADWVPFDNNQTVKAAPKVTIISDDALATIVKIDISGFELTHFTNGTEHFQRVDLLTDAFITKEGYPALPHIAEIIAVPDQASISVEIIEMGSVHKYENINIAPARASWFEGLPESAYEKNEEAFQSQLAYPVEQAELGSPAIFRDFRISRLAVYPFRYIAATKELQAVSTITVKVSYGNGAAVNPKTTTKHGIAPSFDKIYSASILNYKEVLQSRFNGNLSGREKMLCIMPDEFTASFQEYADWKRESGTDVHISSFSDISANSSNPEIIKNHITDAYQNWEYPPTYILLVGDNGVFPRKTITYPDYSFAHEDYFVEIEGNDFFPEMMIGRFTNQGDYRMRVMINKYMKYEKEPYTANTDWFKKAICCSNNLYESQVGTKRHTAKVMLEDGGFTSVDTMMSDGNGFGGNGCTYDEGDVVAKINEGRSWLNYRGEGWSSGWNATCYNFNTSDVSSLNNGEQLTFVTSIGCGVAMFDSGGGNCFGEEWIQLGSLSSIRGGVAFVGPTSNTHTTYNNRIDKGIYEGMFREGMDTPGQALLRGKLYMYNVFGTDSWVEYHYRVFCVLGDPSLHVWKDVPLAVTVDHPTTLPIGFSQSVIEVIHTASGLPVDSAQVTITGPDVFETAFTNAQGEVVLGLSPLTTDTLTITVRGGNVIPYQSTIVVEQTAEHIGLAGTATIIDITGNTDGLINPNENCELTFALKNWGSQTAINVQATLTSLDTNVQIITTTPINFGDLTSGGSAVGSPFEIKINPNCKIGESFAVQLNITSNTNNWDYLYNNDVTGCNLRYDDFVVNDAAATVVNYRMDPGETVKLYIAIENNGFDLASSVQAILQSNDPYITVEDSLGTFGTIGVGGSSMNNNNYFVVTVDAACPMQHEGMYTLKLNTLNGFYPYHTELQFTIPVGLPQPSDYTGPDDYGYYAYSSDDSIFAQAPSYNWMDIETIGTEINVTSSDYTVSVPLPFNFKYYGIDYSELRISSDGWVAFGSGNQTSYENASLPNNDAVNCMVAAFWDDLYDNNWEDGKLFYYDDSANDRFVVSWNGIAHYGDNSDPDPETFQLVLYDPSVYPTATGDGEIVVHYKEITNGSSNTIGIENHSQDVGLQYVYNNSYALTASELLSLKAIKFTTETPVIMLADEDILENGFSSNGFVLEQNYPNPFSEYTHIKYTIPTKSNVNLNIYSVTGSLVRSFNAGEQQAGIYTVKWNGMDEAGNKVSNGVYLYRLQTENYINTKRLFLIK